MAGYRRLAALSGSLVIVGTGIGSAQLTTEARAAIAGAEDVLFLVGDPVSERVILDLAPQARSLSGLYEHSDTYGRMTEAILDPARRGRRVCAAFYGHPGVFVLPSRDAIARARAEGIEARMLPGISALDCLFADLAVDPAASGCQTYEAGDFVRRRPAIEPRAALVLLQVGVSAVDKVVEALLDSYPSAHEVVVYEASPYPGIAPLVEPVALERLGDAALSQRSTLYVPPVDRA